MGERRLRPLFQPKNVNRRSGTSKPGCWGGKTGLPTCMQPPCSLWRSATRAEEGALCLHEALAYLLGDQLPVLVLHGAILCEDVVKLTDD